MQLLKFSEANAKTKKLKDIPKLAKYLSNKKKVYSLDLLSGWSCPFAYNCEARVHVKSDGKRFIKDGINTSFRCFSASQEVFYTNLYNLRNYNFDLIRECKDDVSKILQLLVQSLPKNAGIVRFHVAGDFFCYNYFAAAIELTKLYPNILFYGYTKSLGYLYKLRKECDDLSQGIIRPNFLMTASLGGRLDYYIRDHLLKIRTAKVVFAENETNLPIDHDDSHAATKGGNFALLLHGKQPKGSTASKALVLLKGVGSYGKTVAV